MKFKEFETVVLLEDIESEGLAAGEIGTVLETKKDPELYLVEFIHEDGDDPLLGLRPDQLGANV